MAMAECNGSTMANANGDCSGGVLCHYHGPPLGSYFRSLSECGWLVPPPGTLERSSDSGFRFSLRSRCVGAMVMANGHSNQHNHGQSGHSVLSDNLYVLRHIVVVLVVVIVVIVCTVVGMVEVVVIVVVGVG